MAPKVSVLMPVYNGEKYLREAIESILKQSFADFEFLIINDGSTDKSREIILSFTDPRIRLIDNEENLKLIKTLNKGFKLAKGEYIARMDADDISLPQRLEKQVKFMSGHPKIGACGTLVRTIGKQGGFVANRLIDPEEIRANHLFHTSLAHPSVMIRKEIIEKHGFQFDEKFIHCEDYEFWTRFAKISKLSNLNEVLLLYRIHDNNISSVYSQIQNSNKSLVRESELRAFGLDPAKTEMTIHQQLKCNRDLELNDFLNTKEKWFLKLLSHNEKKQYYDKAALKRVLKNQWLSVCQINAPSGLHVFRRCLASPLIKSLSIKDFRHFIKIFLKSISKITG